MRIKERGESENETLQQVLGYIVGITLRQERAHDLRERSLSGSCKGHIGKSQV